MDRKNLAICILVIYLVCRILWLVFAVPFQHKQVTEVEPVTQDVIEQPLPETPMVTTPQDGVISFPINRPQNFNDKTKNDIYDIRRMNVGNSPLYPENYTPSDAVFGQIVSGKPWYGKYDRPCEAGKSNVTRGESLLSTTINNPNILIQPFPLAKTPNLPLDSDFCRANDTMLFVPRKIEYTPSKKLLEITYPLDEIIIGKNVLGKRLWLLLTALNARDAGYNYITATGIEGGIFYDSTWDGTPYDNIGEIVFKFNDYIHLGTSCGIEGGCNNISPRQMPMEFELRSNPAKIRLKLWKNEPASRGAAPDLYCNLIFE